MLGIVSYFLPAAQTKRTRPTDQQVHWKISGMNYDFSFAEIYNRQYSCHLLKTNQKAVTQG